MLQIMRIKHVNKFLTILTILLFNYCYSQNNKDLYIYFKQDSLGICNHSMYRDGHDKVRLEFIYNKYENDSLIRFGLCKQNFEFYAKLHKAEKLSIKNFKKLKFVPIDEIITETEKKWPVSNKLSLNNSIYIIEQNRDGSYYKYPVNWTERIIN